MGEACVCVKCERAEASKRRRDQRFADSTGLLGLIVKNNELTSSGAAARMVLAAGFAFPPCGRGEWREYQNALGGTCKWWEFVRKSKAAQTAMHALAVDGVLVREMRGGCAFYSLSPE